MPTEDELAKKTIQDAIWTWSGRILTILVVYAAGWFTGWVMWGSGTSGAPTLRAQKVELESNITDLKNQRVGIEGRLTVTEGRLQECQKAPTTARTAAAAAQGQGGTP